MNNSEQPASSHLDQIIRTIVLRSSVIFQRIARLEINPIPTVLEHIVSLRNNLHSILEIHFIVGKFNEPCFRVRSRSEGSYDTRMGNGAFLVLFHFAIIENLKGSAKG